ncbi:uncharacterized protein DUF3515 [Rathayibacter sp. PhB93]|uniref:DUF3515 family protein n=1 Tax=unclassified Rathayibacter TaxID=2609250 RepID=UPI000F49C579|nr:MULTISPECIES: DUF3515 family protein [unclassified Rathayibacter]ROQ06778.1 uncharacterized protein DUF3515 [Rathayibacter sp. PhB93]TDQ14535.1 uncharacterized protein DUF3515 [Rathayibacter sp. PhB1]
MSSSADRSRRALPVVALLALATSGCTGTVPMQPAPTAADIGCAEIAARLPSDVVGLTKRATDAQGTGAWGEPALVLLRCGVPDPGPSAACITERDVDWTIDDSDAAVVVATSYGRDPVVEVVLGAGLSGGREIPAALAPAVSSVPATRRCS